MCNILSYWVHLTIPWYRYYYVHGYREEAEARGGQVALAIPIMCCRTEMWPRLVDSSLSLLFLYFSTSRLACLPYPDPPIFSFLFGSSDFSVAQTEISTIGINFPWPWRQPRRRDPCSPSPIMDRGFPLIALIPSFPLWRSFVLIRKIGTKRHWGACILSVFPQCQASSRPLPPGPYLEQNWKSHCRPLSFFKSQLFWAFAFLMLWQFTPLFCLVPLSR